MAFFYGWRRATYAKTERHASKAEGFIHRVAQH